MVHSARRYDTGMRHAEIFGSYNDGSGLYYAPGWGAAGWWARSAVVRLVTGSLMARTLALICAPLALTIVAAVVGAVGVTGRDARRALEERAQLTVQILAGGAGEALWNLDAAAARALLRPLSHDPDYFASLILDEAGQVFVRHGTHAPGSPAAEVPTAGVVVVRAVLIRGIGDAAHRPIGTLELWLTTARADHETVRRGWAIAGIGSVLLVVVCAALAVIIHGVTRPVSRMTRVMSELAAGRIEVPVPRVCFEDEIGRMAAALTTLKAHAAERLQFIARQARHVDEIERAVVERTRALTGTLETLQRAQTELVRSEKLAVLGSMVAAIAHEINTPLGNSLTVASTLGEQVKGFNQMQAEGALRRSALREFSRKLDAGTHLLIANLTRAAELIGSFKRVAVDQTSERRRTFELAATMTEIITTLWPTYKKTGYEIVCELAPGIVMDSYPGALSQVITNLITNAVIHAFEGRDTGTIRIDASVTASQANGDSCCVLLTVADDGNGISGDVLPRIFDPFFTTRLGAGGSGLGLHIVHLTVSHMLGGTIAARSVLQAGTIFTLRLPLAAPVHASNQGGPES